MENKCYQSTNEDLRKSDLEHYENLSTECHHWSSGIPRAINFYYDYKSLSIWEKIKLSFKK
jgi:hypothetical protein